MKYILTSLLFICYFSLWSQSDKGAQLCKLSGLLIDQNSKEPILFGTVALYKNDKLVAGTETDLDGNFKFTDVPSGVYKLEASYVGYESTRQSVTVTEKQEELEIILNEGRIIDCVIQYPYFLNLFELDNTSSIRTFNSDQIRRAAY